MNNTKIFIFFHPHFYFFKILNEFLNYKTFSPKKLDEYLDLCIYIISLGSLKEDSVLALIPTYSIGPTFLGTKNTDPNAPICIAGIPFDIGTTNRSGSRDGPHAIRRASRMLVDGHHPTLWSDVNALPFSDVGNIETRLGEIELSLDYIKKEAQKYKHLVTLGGDHTITLGLLRARMERTGQQMALIHFDAHVDTWPDNFGHTYGHGSVFYHAIREGLVNPKHMIQIGIRSPVSREVYDWTRDQGVKIISAMKIHELFNSDSSTLTT